MDPVNKDIILTVERTRTTMKDEKKTQRTRKTQRKLFAVPLCLRYLSLRIRRMDEVGSFVSSSSSLSVDVIWFAERLQLLGDTACRDIEGKGL